MIPFRKPRHRAGAVGLKNVLRITYPRLSHVARRAPPSARRMIRDSIHIKHLAVRLLAPPLRGRRVAFAVAMHKSNHPPAPGVKSKTCVLHHTLVFRWNDGQKFALPSGAPLASRPGMWPASQPCTACSASDRAGVRSWHWHRHYCQAGRQPSAARVCSARRFIMRHARALCDSDRILGFMVSGRQPRAVGSCWHALYTRMGFLDGWRRVRVGAVVR